MTKSQITSIVATLAALLTTVEAQLGVLTAVLPPQYAKWLRVAVIVGGVLVTAFNQSLNTNHVSVPVEEAKALGLKSKQLEGK